MKFGLIYNTGYYGTDPDQLIAAARHAEACGFESFYLTEGLPTELLVSYRQNCFGDLFLSIARGSDNGSGRRLSWFRRLRWPVAGLPAGV